MFHDEDPFIFKKMHEFSTVDGFVEVSECLAEMIKYVANEPSLGFFYIQQHIRNSGPNLVSLKNNVSEKSQETTLHTEDSEDSILMIRSMKECGYIIAEEMIKDITSSLAIMATKQPKKGLIRSSSSSFKMGRRSWSPPTWGRSPSSNSEEGSSSYLSRKLSNFRWPQIEPSQDKSGVNNSLDELPISSQVSDEIKEVETDQSEFRDELCTLTEDYDEFKADKEAKLMEWLGEATYGDDDNKRQELVKVLGKFGDT